MENKKLWFRAKNYGYGWYPITVQGWLVLVLYLLAVVSLALNVKNIINTNSLVYLYFIPLFVLTAFMILICYLTGEKAEWRWGKKKQEEVIVNK